MTIEILALPSGEGRNALPISPRQGDLDLLIHANNLMATASIQSKTQEYII
jgi:hypothetical protein